MANQVSPGLDLTVASSLVGAVTTFVSAVGTADPGTPLDLPAPEDSYTSMVLALDGNGNAVAGAMAWPGSTGQLTLTSTSTASVLVRILLGPLPEGTSEQAAVSAIQQAPGFQQLVTDVLAAFVAGQRPQSEASVAADLVVVVQQVGAVIFQTQSSTLSRTPEHAQHVLSLPGPTVPAQLPYSIYGPSSFGGTAAQVTIFSAYDSGGAANGVNMMNRQPYYWSASSKDLQGNALAGPVELPGVPFFEIIGLSPDVVPVAGNGTEFALTVEQTQDSRLINIAGFALDHLAMVSGVATYVMDLKKVDCVLAPMQQLLTADGAGKFLTTGSREDFYGLFGSIFSLANIPSLVTAAGKMLPCIAPKVETTFTGAMVGALNKAGLEVLAATPVEEILLLTEGGSLFGRELVYLNYFGATSTVVVCESPSPAQVIACPAPAVSMTVYPAQIAAGGTSNLSWNSAEGGTCTATGSWAGAQANNGSMTVSQAQPGNYVYTLTCTEGGSQAIGSASLTVVSELDTNPADAQVEAVFGVPPWVELNQALEFQTPPAAFFAGGKYFCTEGDQWFPKGADIYSASESCVRVFGGTITPPSFRSDLGVDSTGAAPPSGNIQTIPPNSTSFAYTPRCGAIFTLNDARTIFCELWGVVPPSAPSGLIATVSVGNGPQQVTLNWVPADDSMLYSIYGGAAPGAEASVPIETAVAGTAAVLSGFASGTRYYFRVAGYNGAGQSPMSSELAVSIP